MNEVPGDLARSRLRQEVVAKFLAYSGPVVLNAHAEALAARLLDGALGAPTSLGP